MLPWETGIGEPGHYDDWLDEIKVGDEDMSDNNGTGDIGDKGGTDDSVPDGDDSTNGK